MKPNELEKIYHDACFAKGYEPNDGQFKVWKQTLGWLEKQDLEAALTGWYGSETNFPMPAEIKPLAMANKHRRETQAAQPLDLVRWRCSDCKITMAGFIPPSDEGYRRCVGIPRDRKYGQNFQGEKICGAVMNIENRILNYKSDAPWGSHDAN